MDFNSIKIAPYSKLQFYQGFAKRKTLVSRPAQQKTGQAFILQPPPIRLIFVSKPIKQHLIITLNEFYITVPIKLVLCFITQNHYSALRLVFVHRSWDRDIRYCKTILSTLFVLCSVQLHLILGVNLFIVLNLSQTKAI